ncbi:MULTISPECIES: DUF5590 domain-containing protein [Paraliobacillus]|uniref:cell wall elongation regulator TseB-like domain-containing protein n=1 Tax=Paraliobacillus TaxID=200903 RepID=UPI000DD3182A|nr:MULTISPECIES: DUF5590 domain-containing protein [Paraliobacillus]
MKKQSLLFTVPNWLSWILVGFILLIIGIFVYSVILYQTVEANKTSDFSTSEERVLEETAIIEIDDISRYHGEIYYNVVEGQTETGDSILAFVEVSNQEVEIKTFELSNFLDKNTLLSQWQNSCSTSCELLQSQYGIRGDTPLLELSYFDAEDRLSYAYYRLDDGSYDSGVSFSNDY